jgi:hypothetical protein
MLFHEGGIEAVRMLTFRTIPHSYKLHIIEMKE